MLLVHTSSFEEMGALIFCMLAPPLFSWYPVWANCIQQLYHLIISDGMPQGMPLYHVAIQGPEYNGPYFVHIIFEFIFLNEMYCILIEISLNFIHNGSVDN